MIRIVCDSGADIPEDILDRYSIQVVPLSIRFGQTEMVDQLELSTQDFWERLKDSPDLPEVVAPSVNRFVDTFERLGVAGAEGVVAVTMSSDFSASYQIAVLAAQQASIPVSVVDSRSVSMAEGWVAIQAARASEERLPLSEVEFVAETVRHRVHVLAVIDTLKYLERGGQVKPYQAKLGTMLDIKPMITVRDGVVTPAGRVRSLSKGLSQIVADVKSHGDRLEDLAILHSEGIGLEALEDALGDLANFAVRAEIGPVVGTHAGPGALGVAYRLQ